MPLVLPVRKSKLCISIRKSICQADPKEVLLFAEVCLKLHVFMTGAVLSEGQGALALYPAFNLDKKGLEKEKIRQNAIQTTSNFVKSRA